MIFDYTIITCGTAGHVFPALAVIESLLPNYKVALIIDNKAYKRFEKILQDKKYKNLFVLQTIPFYFDYKCLFTLLKNIKTTWSIIKNSNLLIGFVAGLQIPTLFTCVLLNKKFILHEQDTILNKTNSIFGFFSYKIYTSFNKVSSYKFLQKKMLWRGCPVNITNNNVTNKDLTNGKKYIITIFAGTNGSHFMDEIIPNELMKINNIQDCVIYHNCKKENIEIVENFYKKNNICAYVSVFFDNFQDLYKYSNLLITRGGASTISYLNFYKKKAILIPWPDSSKNHQYFNCKLIEQENFIEVIEEKDFSNLSKKINNILQNPEDSHMNNFKVISGDKYII
jgi:UDP-N-acetylglucosamine--N-acetylmuramyl-(pentapeptide) pyrophosphoryl-undecaprenol N-acetylglucosamine transferase